MRWPLRFSQSQASNLPATWQVFTTKDYFWSGGQKRLAFLSLFGCLWINFLATCVLNITPPYFVSRRVVSPSLIKIGILFFNWSDRNCGWLTELCEFSESLIAEEKTSLGRLWQGSRIKIVSTFCIERVFPETYLTYLDLPFSSRLHEWRSHFSAFLIT